MTEQTEVQNEVNLKVVISTLIWTNSGSDDLPMWKASGGKEYIVARLDRDPTWEEVAELVDQKRHLVETHVEKFHETMSGWQVYHAEGMTHSEFLQYKLTDYVEFPAIDLTNLDEEDGQPT